MNKDIGNSNIFRGNSSNIQIQQDAVNSNQAIVNDSENIDFDKVNEIFTQIRNNMDLLGVSDAIKKEITDIINDVQTNVDEKNEPHRVKQALATIKDFLVGVSGSLAASGILHMISIL
jgi:hypothetical protein